MRNSTSSMTESSNCAPTSTSSTSCFTSHAMTTLPPMPTVPNASTISYATPWCLMLQYKDAMNLFNIASKGDHRAMVIDFNTNRLFGNPTTTLATPAQREFSSKDAGSNRKYIPTNHKYLTHHHFASCLAHLQEAWNPDLAEQLDRVFQRASTSAAKSVQRKPNAPYITKLANLHKEKNVLKQILFQHRTGIDLSSSIAYQVRDDHDFLVPETIPECQQHCCEAQQEIRQLEKDSVILRVEEQIRLH